MKKVSILILLSLFVSTIAFSASKPINATKKQVKTTFISDRTTIFTFSEIVEGGTIEPKKDKASPEIGYICCLISSTPWSYQDMAGFWHYGVTNTYSCTPIPPMMI